MKFPGSKLLHHWDLSTDALSLDDLLRACRQAGLTGFAEIKLRGAVAMIFYYLGGEVNAVCREGALVNHGQAALDRLRARVPEREGEISVYELPLDMAHLLRGISNRQKLKETVKTRAALQELLFRMEKAAHTGTLEIQTAAGAAMVLLVRGRVSNTYWESSGGLTYEKGEARARLEQAVGEGPAQIFLAEFSRDVWKSRHEVQTPLKSRLERRDEAAAAPPTDQVAAEEATVRNEILDELQAELPATVQTFFFDLMTGVILARSGRGITALRVGLLCEKVPFFTLYLRDLVAAEEEDQVEAIELSTGRVVTLVGIVPEAQEAIAVVADRAQPTALIAAALHRAVRAYVARLHPARGAVAR